MFLPSDLAFKKGDVVTLRRQIDDNWYQGELRGQIGVFPASYVQVGDSVHGCGFWYGKREREHVCRSVNGVLIFTLE